MSAAYLGFQTAQWLANVLPKPMVFGLADCLADLQWRRSGRARRSVQANLSLVLGADIDEYAPSVRNVFRNFARYLVEFLTMHRVHNPQVSWEGTEHLQETLRRHRRAIALTAHIGNWELAAVLVRRTGVQVRAIALPHAQPNINRLFNLQRARCRLDVIPTGPAVVRRGLHGLQQEGLLGILGDWALAGEGIRVSLCGRAVRFPRGPALLSLRSQAPMLPIFLIREGVWKFRLCIEPPMYPQRSSRKADAMHALIQAYASTLERYIQRYPEQWLLFHPVSVSSDTGDHP